MAGDVTDYSMKDGEEPDQKAATPELDKDDLFLRFKRWMNEDKDHSERWHKRAKEEYAIRDDDQWLPQDKQDLIDQGRVPVVFNRVRPVIHAVVGQEVANRQEVRYIPRQATQDPNQGADGPKTEILTEAARWFRDCCDAEHEESNAFADTVAVGMGWTETRINYEENPEGAPEVNRIDPMEMLWDAAARKANLTDARRIWRRRCEVPIEEARGLFPDVEDEDLDAKWAERDSNGKEPNDSANPRYDGSSVEETGAMKTVTLVQVQWREKEPYYTAALQAPIDPMAAAMGMPAPPPEMKDLEVAEYQKALKRGLVTKGVKRIRTVYWQAWVGAKVLEANKLVAPSGKPCVHFNFVCITGHLEQKTGHFYGLIRGMVDPQRFANKMLSSTIHIISTNANGGLMLETGAVEDQVEFERNWARPDKPTYFKDGKLQKGAVQPKPATALPAAHMSLMEFGINSIPGTSGVNYEQLGLSDRDQPASLEYQRKQSGLTILAPLFDSLKRYRRLQGRVLLYLITEYLSDSRLIRIVGDNGDEYVPLLKQPGTVEYDVIVDDSPTSPNQKEATWGFFQQILPVLGPTMTRDEIMIILEDSPLPPSRLAKLKALGDEKAQQPPPPDPAVEKMKAELQIKQEGAQLDAGLEQQRLVMDQERERAKMELERERSQNDIMIAREKAQNDMVIARFKATGQQRLAGMKANAQITMEAQSQASDTEDEQMSSSVEPMADPDMADPAMSRLAEAMESMARGFEMLARAQTSPRRIVRDPATGRALRAETVMD